MQLGESSCPDEWHKMTPITAKVRNVVRVGEQYFVGVQVGRDNYSGTFDGLNFGESKPQTGWYLYDWLDRLTLLITEIQALEQGSHFRYGAIL